MSLKHSICKYQTTMNEPMPQGGRTCNLPLDLEFISRNPNILWLKQCSSPHRCSRNSLWPDLPNLGKLYVFKGNGFETSIRCYCPRVTKGRHHVDSDTMSDSFWAPSFLDDLKLTGDGFLIECSSSHFWHLSHPARLPQAHLWRLKKATDLNSTGVYCYTWYS